MPKYLIHIGPHKTGSTYLQAAFQTMRAQLLERGVWYPELWQGQDKLSHHRLPQRLRAKADDGLTGEFASLNARRYDTILISAEDLSDLRSDDIALFKSLLGGAPARVIFYCRRWSELLPSGWQELIKHGDTITFPELLSGHMVNCFGSHVINYSQTLARYAEHFTPSNISLVSYSNIVDGGGDLFINSCQNFLSWNDPPRPLHGRVNVSLGTAEVEIVRAFVSTGKEREDFDLSELLAAIETNVARARVNEGLGALQYLHSELFRQFGSLLVEPRSGPRLFAPKLSEIPYVRQDYLLANGVADLIQGVYRRIHGVEG